MKQYENYKCNVCGAEIEVQAVGAGTLNCCGCEVCGHVHRGKKAPKACLLCKAGQEYFKKACDPDLAPKIATTPYLRDSNFYLGTTKLIWRR